MPTSYWFLALTHSTTNLIGPWTTHTNTQSHTDTTCTLRSLKHLKKRQRKPESGIKGGFEEMEHERNFRLKHYDSFNRTTFSDVPLLLKLGSLSENVFEPCTSTGSVVCYTAVLSVVMQRSSQALRDDTKNGCVADYRKWGLLAFYLPWSWQICFAKFLFS